jgi:hypothetical protein
MVVVLDVVAARLAALTSRSNDAGPRGHFSAADAEADVSARKFEWTSRERRLR